MSVRYRRADQVDWVVAGDESILLDSSSGELFELDRWATSIWAALDGNESVDDISESIAKAVNAPKDVVHNDVISFCIELSQRELIVPMN